MGKGQKARLAARRERERILEAEWTLQAKTRAEAEAEAEIENETGVSVSSPPLPDSIVPSHLPAIESVEDFPALPSCGTSISKEKAKEQDENDTEMVSEDVPEAVPENRNESGIESINQDVPKVLITDYDVNKTSIATASDNDSEDIPIPVVTLSQPDLPTMVRAGDETESQAKYNQRTKRKNKRKQEKRRAAAIDAASERSNEIETIYPPQIVCIPFYYQYPPGMAPSYPSVHHTYYPSPSPGYQSFNPHGGLAYSSYGANSSSFGSANMNSYRPRRWNSRPNRYIQREWVNQNRSHNRDAGERTQFTELRATAPEFVPDSKQT